MIRAVTLDYWDTLVDDRVLQGERLAMRHEAIRTLLHEYERALAPDELNEIYHQAGVEALRWWREEHRGYTTEERIRWMLSLVDVQPPRDCRHLARAVALVDDALVHHPPRLFPGARELLESLSTRVRLAIVSDTGFASGQGQDRLLEHHGVRRYFAATIYSMDVGHAKPRPEPFRAALDALGAEPHDVVHVGDIEQTDVKGALAAGMRAVRLDLVRDGGESAAEYVARSYEELLAYLAGD